MQGLRRNIELKCRCADLGEARQRARELGATDAGVLALKPGDAIARPYVELLPRRA